MFEDRYFWGAPGNDTENDAYRTAVLKRAAQERAGDFNAVFRVDHAMDRVTDKSAGLLQADSILAAIATFFAYQANLLPWAANLNVLALGLALFSCLLLMLNLAVVWAKDPMQVYTDATKTFKFQMSICKPRTTRFMWALLLSLGAFLCTLVSVALQFFGT